MPDPVQLHVNGRPVTVEADGDTPLLYVLRNDLKLKGTRYGCGEGLCGACAVLVDGVRVFSCQTPLWSVQGKPVTTIEGLGTVDAPHPLQQAVLDEQAAQCGYCLAGILISAKALLDRDPAPDDEAVRAALDRHLCRCGTHTRILRAVQRAAAMLRGEDVEPATLMPSGAEDA